MSTTTQLAEVRRQATEYARLQQAAALLPEMERQAEMEAAEAKAQARAEELTEALDAELAKLDGRNTTSAQRLLAAVGQLCDAIEERQAVQRDAGRVFQIAKQLATVQYRRPAGPVDPTSHVAFFQGDVQVRAEQLLIDKGYRNARLMTLRSPSDELGQLLVEFIGRITGDFIEAPHRDPVAGPVVVIGHDGQSRWG